jgi:DNA-binding HxlR family transcriptional regulator
MLKAEDLRRLGEGRWAVPVLALLADEKGARFARLAAALAVPRESLARTLVQLTESGWVARNSGHGHPLRPEYVLTLTGLEVGAACARMMAVRRRLGLAPSNLPRWSLPILGEVERDWARFTDLRAALAPVTPRALSLNLQQMIAGSLLARRIEPDFPPTARYGLGGPGRELVASLRG